MTETLDNPDDFFQTGNQEVMKPKSIGSKHQEEGIDNLKQTSSGSEPG